MHIYKITCSGPLPYAVGQPMTDKYCMKRCLEFEKNDVSHMTFAWMLTCWPALSCVLPILNF